MFISSTLPVCVYVLMAINDTEKETRAAAVGPKLEECPIWTIFRCRCSCRMWLYKRARETSNKPANGFVYHSNEKLLHFIIWLRAFRASFHCVPTAFLWIRHIAPPREMTLIVICFYFVVFNYLKDKHILNSLTFRVRYLCVCLCVGNWCLIKVE